ncbi:TPA: hypothetical protein ACHSUJ_004893, partial [Escherichia coli]
NETRTGDLENSPDHNITKSGPRVKLSFQILYISRPFRVVYSASCSREFASAVLGSILLP